MRLKDNLMLEGLNAGDIEVWGTFMYWRQIWCSIDKLNLFFVNMTLCPTKLSEKWYVFVFI